MPSKSKEFIHILNDLSSLLPSVSSSINLAASIFSFSVASKPGHLLKICATNNLFKFSFPEVISLGSI
jgi:hypothetical protein